VADSPAVAVSKRYFDAVRRRDLDAAIECWVPGGIDHLAPVGELRVPDEWRTYFSELFAAIPDWKYEVLNLFEQGDQVAVHWRASGHFSGQPYEGIRATGAAILAEGADLIKVENGLIKRLDSYWDESAMARQIGLIPAKWSRQERVMVGLFNTKTRLKSALQRSKS
jgi:predicted ester cyclase